MKIETTDLGKYFYVVNCWDYVANETIKGIRKVRLIGIRYIYKNRPNYSIKFSAGFYLGVYEDMLYRTREEAEQKLKEIENERNDL